jgi:hypothetical protein
VQYLRPQHAATQKRWAPATRIDENKERKKPEFDLTDGFHPMSLKKEHRYFTFMSTTRGTQQWKVQVMGLKNPGKQFQRMVEWVLPDLPHTDPYMDDTITGSHGKYKTEEVWVNFHDTRALLNSLRKTSWSAVSTNLSSLKKKACSVGISCGQAAGVPARAN